MIWQLCCCKRFDKYHVCPWADEFFQRLPLKSNGRDECQLIRGWTGYSPTDKEGFCLLGQTSRWEGDGCCWGGQVSKGGWKAGEGGGTREANKGRTKWPGIENEGDRAASESEAWMEIVIFIHLYICGNNISASFLNHIFDQISCCRICTNYRFLSIMAAWDILTPIYMKLSQLEVQNRWMFPLSSLKDCLPPVQQNIYLSKL